jgi:hypothetical protein
MNLRSLAFSLLSASACSAGGAEEAPRDTTLGDPNVLAGAFVVRLPSVPLGAERANLSVVGKVYDGPTPELIIWEQVAESGACVLRVPRVPLCLAACGGDAACVKDDTCKPYPIPKSVGTVTVSGMRTSAGTTEFSMSPVADNYQPPAGVSLPATAFGEGDAIRFSAAGGGYAPFVLETRGIAALSLDGSSIPVNEGEAVSLSWTPAVDATAARIEVKLDLSHHGGSNGKIECDAPDDGSLEIGADLITQLLALGVAGFPTIIVTRQAVASATIAPGRVDLMLVSEAERSARIVGLESCNKDAECRPPKRCAADLTCQ